MALIGIIAQFSMCRTMLNRPNAFRVNAFDLSPNIFDIIDWVSWHCACHRVTCYYLGVSSRLCVLIVLGHRMLSELVSSSFGLHRFELWLETPFDPDFGVLFFCWDGSMWRCDVIERKLPLMQPLIFRKYAKLICYWTTAARPNSSHVLVIDST